MNEGNDKMGLTRRSMLTTAGLGITAAAAAPLASRASAAAPPGVARQAPPSLTPDQALAALKQAVTDGQASGKLTAINIDDSGVVLRS